MPRRSARHSYRPVGQFPPSRLVLNREMGTKSERTVPRLIKRLVQVKEFAYGKTNLSAFSRFTPEDGCVWGVVLYALRMVRPNNRIRPHAGSDRVVSKVVERRRVARHRKLVGHFFVVNAKYLESRAAK